VRNKKAIVTGETVVHEARKVDGLITEPFRLVSGGSSHSTLYTAAKLTLKYFFQITLLLRNLSTDPRCLLECP
jgi:hypothetical protein